MNFQVLSFNTKSFAVFVVHSCSPLMFLITEKMRDTVCVCLLECKSLEWTRKLWIEPIRDETSRDYEVSNWKRCLKVTFSINVKAAVLSMTINKNEDRRPLNEYTLWMEYITKWTTFKLTFIHHTHTYHIQSHSHSRYAI